MEQLQPKHVPVYETDTERRALWERCVDRGQPVIAIRDASRGYIVRYDIQHLDAELVPDAVQRLRERTRRWRSYPTADANTDGDAGGQAGTDPISESEGVGGETGPISGDLHAATERDARELASRLSAVVFDRSNWQA